MAALIGLDSTSSGFDPGLQDPPITFGVWGDSGDADGVIGSSNTGVGVFGRSVDVAATAVRGSSQNGTGVDATSAGGTALHARRDPGGGAAVTEAFLATPSLAADFRGDVATSGALRVGGRPGAAGELRARPGGGVELTVVPEAGSPRPVLSVDGAGGDIAIAPQGGNIGIGLGARPAQRPLHVEGKEVHSGGSLGGFSFADRSTREFVESPNAGQRWRWYAEGGTARLWSGADRLTIDKSGNIGIGIGTAPAQRPLHVEGKEVQSGGSLGGFSFADRSSGSFVENPTAGQRWRWYAEGGTARLWSGTDRLTIDKSGNIGIGMGAQQAGALYFGGTTDTGRIGMRLFGGNIDNRWQGGFIDVRAGTPADGLILRVDTFLGGTEQMRINALGNVGIGTTAPRARLEVNGNIRAANIGLTNDCAEDFDICETEQVEPGTVMVVGEEGVLYPSQRAYDKRVAGVISGAGDYARHRVRQAAVKQHRKPIALFGKVYCKVNAQDGAIEVGDLLTTSPMPGHAMKADDPLQAFGAVIGKALRSLKEGQGLIPILIALQ